ncbi:MAG: GNAT family N-acetyltransferase [Eubacterium sp.]|nr:GNAT family N-acetyltransferase [Eubacterium sp.]MCM1409646.1 GNAT family N-acetyltransferase [Lachnospiraceae bacterium]
MIQYILKKMESEDEINGKGYVHYKSWHETYTGLIDTAYLNQTTLEKCTDIAHKWPDNIMVAKDGEKVIGFVGYGPYRDETLPAHGEIFSIYVLAEYQGRKIGYELMNAALNKLSDYKKIAVWVLKENSGAIRFYERYGFHMDGTESEIMLGTANIEIRMVYERSMFQ